MPGNKDSAQLVLRGITKNYAALVANNNIDLSVGKGEIHAILGENGAGKSTLMKIIYGVTQATSGDMYWQGEKVVVTSPAHARSLGIGMVFQHFSLFETLSVVENVAIALPGKPDMEDLAHRIEAVSNRYDLPVDPYCMVHELSVGERQRVEIIRCLLQNPSMLIMDEPTSVLAPQAVRKLFETLRHLASEGCSILYISHKLDEIQELCHKATVLRGGKVTGTCIPSEETPASMAKMMIGQELPVCQRGDEPSTGEIRLQVNKLSLNAPSPFGTDLKEISLDVRAGEILGIAGVSGNGQQELMYAISGEVTLRQNHDSILINGKAAGHLAPAHRRDMDMCFVPEERLGRGAVPEMSLAENALLTAYGANMLKHGMIRENAVMAFTRKCIERFNVMCSGPMAPAQSLSGGNLQKFIMGREIMQDPSLLVVSQPTWGVDVGAAAFIRQSLIDMRNAGVAILVVSEELEELFEICDRIAVISNGRLSPSRRPQDTSIEEIGTWMSGMWPQESNEETMPGQPTAQGAATLKEATHVA